MPLHTQVDESSQDAGLDVNPVYVSELSCEIPRYRLPERGVLPAHRAAGGPRRAHP